MTPDTESYQRMVGTLTHRAVADIAGRGPGLTDEELASQAWTTARELVRAQPELGSRSRAARLVIATSAAVYVRCFLPPAPWSLSGAEVEIEGGRIDLVWTAPDTSVVYDELKLAGALGRPTGQGPTSRQTARYSAHGLATHGERFAGVRLVLLGAPRHSMLIGPGDRLRRLADTPFWFEGKKEAFR